MSSCRSRLSSSTSLRYCLVEGSISLRRFGISLAAFALVLVRVGFPFTPQGGGGGSLHRGVVPTTRTGLDTGRGGPRAQLFTVVLLFAGVAIFLYVAGPIVEIIARAVQEDCHAGEQQDD